MLNQGLPLDDACKAALHDPSFFAIILDSTIFSKKIIRWLRELLKSWFMTKKFESVFIKSILFFKNEKKNNYELGTIQILRT